MPRCSTPIGAPGSMWNRKLTDAAVAEIRAALKLRRETHPKLLAARYGVSPALIYLIANGKEYGSERL